MCGLVEAALNRGFQVAHLGLLPSEGYDASNDILFSPKNGGSFLTQEILYYSRRWGNKIESYFNFFDHSILNYFAKTSGLLSQSYDGIIAFDSLPIGLSRRVNAKIHISILGDPVGDRFLKSTFQSWTWLYRMFLGYSIQFIEKRYYRYRLNPSWKVGMFGSFHSRVWAKKLHRPVLDLRPFLPSLKNNLSLQPNMKYQSDSPLTLVFGGTLATTASRLAFNFLNDKLLPELQSVLGKGKFTFKFVGYYLSDYGSLIQKFPEVILTGNVPVFETELETCDIFVLPMSYPVGVRTRICSALQAGCFCICDPSVLVNMPELIDCETVKITDDVKTYARIIANLQTDPESRQKYRQKSKSFFEQHYVCDVAAKSILDFVEQV